MSRSLKADQVAAAFNAVPGIIVPVVDEAFTGTQDIGTTGFTDITEGTGTFTVDVPGTYMLKINNWGTYNVSGAGSGQWQLRITGATTWTAPDNALWRTSNLGDERKRFTMEVPLDFNAGDHTFQFAWKRADSATARFDTLFHMQMRLEMISGSGAAGVLLSLKEKTADQTGIAQNVTTLLTELSHTITVVDNEYFVLEYMVIGASASNRTDALLYRVDGGSWLALEAESVPANYWGSLSGSKTIQLSVGSHTIDFAFAQDGANALTVWGVGSYQGVTWRSWTAIRQYRGGQVPWEVDGTEVLSTPRAINIDGATVDYSVADQKLNLSLPKAVTAKGEMVKVVDGGSSTTTSTSYVAVSGASGTFTAETAGTYAAHAMLNFYHTYGSDNRTQVRFRLNIDSGDQYWGEDDATYQHDVTNTHQRGRRMYVFTGDLTAGSHTVQLEWKRVFAQAGSPTVSCDSGEYQTIFFQAVTGSGAGGTILDEAALTADLTGISGSGTEVKLTGLDLAFTAVEGEDVAISWTLQALVGAAPSTQALLIRLDSGSWIVVENDNVPSYWAGFSGTYILSSLPAGAHTVEFGFVCNGGNAATIAGGGTAMFNEYPVAKTWARQVRGGLVPITDGYTTVDKPIAQEYINGSVTESGGKAIISLPQAVTAPGAALILSESPAPTSNIILADDPSETQVLPRSGSLPFEVTTAGLHKINFTCSPVSDGANSSAKFRLVLDEGEANEQVLGNDEDWQMRMTADATNLAQYGYLSAIVTATLTAGSHTAKVYGRDVTGGAATVTFVGSVPVQQPKLVIEAVTGSGAGGTLSYYDHSIGASPDDSASAWHDILRQSGGDPLEVEFPVTKGDIIKASWQGTVVNPSGSGTYMDTRLKLIAPDASESFSSSYRQKFNSTWQDNTWNTLWRWEVTEAGTYKVRGQWYKNGSSLSFSANQRIFVDIERGGLVPHKQDNALVQDKPVAVNYLGPGLQATNVGGQVNVSAQSAAEGMDYDESVLGGNVVLTANPSYVDLVDIDVTTSEGELVIVHYQVKGITTGSAATMLLKFEIDGTPETDRFYNESASGVSYTIWADGAVVRGPFSAGTHNIKITGAYGNTGVTVQATLTKVGVSQFKGGYVTPENVPKLEYSSSSVVNVIKRPGGADRFWLVLSDGKRYYADGTQTVDLSTTGLGGLDTGSEAAATWYCVYAVPTSATSSVFDVVASVTKPSGGGPTGYDAWRYLGVVWNNDSSNIARFKYRGNRCNFVVRNEDDRLIWTHGLGGATPTAQTWLPMSTSRIAKAAPVGIADEVDIAMIMDLDAADLARVYVEPGNPPPFDPAGAFVEWIAAQTGGSGEQQATAWKRMPLEDDGEISIYWNFRTGSIDYSVWLEGFRDRFINTVTTQTQAQYQPDTKRIVLTYASATSVTASPRGGTDIRLTLQDGKQRTVSGSIGFNPSLGATDGGLDTGTEASSTWYYVYLVPKSGDDNSLAVRGSTTAPSSGPTGYTNYWYLGAVYNDSSSDIRKFWQQGNRFDYQERIEGTASAALGVGAVTKQDLSLSDVIPATATGMVYALAVRHATSAGWTFTGVIYVYGETNAYDTAVVSYGAYHQTESNGIIPITTTQKIQYSSSQDGGTHLGQWVYTQGWIDDWVGEATQ